MIISILKINHLISKVLLLLLLQINFSFSQIAVGQWRDHLPYSNALKVAEGDNKIYCSTDNAVFYYDKSDNSLNKLTKVNGLSDIGISAMSFDNKNNVLLIGYSNGNIDLVYKSTVYNVSDIKRKLFSGSKSINNFYNINNYSYVSTGFGIVVLDILNKEIKETYFIAENGNKINVNEIASDGNTIAAATEAGVYSSSLNGVNLSDFNNWEKWNFLPKKDSVFNSIVYFSSKYILSFDSQILNGDSIYLVSNSTWQYFDTDPHTIYSLSVSNNKLLINNSNKIQIFNEQLVLTNSITDFYLSPLYVKYSIFDKDNVLWIADKRNGLVKQSGSNFERFIPNGPSNNRVVSISVEGSNLFAAAGGKNGSWGNLWNSGELHVFKEEEWKSYNGGNNSGLGGILDIVKVLVNPSNSAQTYAASWGYGLLELNGTDVVARYKDDNSSLQSIFPGQNYYRIHGLALDANNNLWVTNSQVEKPFSVKTSTGNWYAFNYSSYINTDYVGDIIVTKDNYKWSILPRGVGLFAFDEKGTYENQEDDEYKKFAVLDENGQIITNDIYSIAEDYEGQIYVGTNKGIVVYYNPENVFSGENFYAHRIIIPSEIEGQAAYLLENELITSIVIDGANRKWIGTESSGIFLMSEDLSEEIHHFTIENSPLLSNNITSIAIDNITGEVFIGTEKGIISYKGTATKGSDNFEKVYTYPNPVRENYNGPITISGLVANSDVKITDISGNLVYETKSEGGQAIWYGKNFEGRKVNTGIYLVFSTNSDGTKTNVTKILVIN